MYMYIYVCVYIFICVYTYLCVCVYIYMCIYTYRTCMYIHKDERVPKEITTSFL